MHSFLYCPFFLREKICLQQISPSNDKYIPKLRNTVCSQNSLKPKSIKQLLKTKPPASFSSSHYPIAYIRFCRKCPTKPWLHKLRHFSQNIFEHFTFLAIQFQKVFSSLIQLFSIKSSVFWCYTLMNTLRFMQVV